MVFLRRRERTDVTDKNKIAEADRSKRAAIELSNALFELAVGLVKTEPAFSAISLHRPKEVFEPKLNEFAPHLKAAKGFPLSYYRWRASVGKQSLSVRASDFLVEVFILPRDDVPLRSYAEFRTRNHASIEQDRQISGEWRLNGEVLTGEHLVRLMQAWLEKLIAAPEKQPEKLRKATISAPPGSPSPAHLATIEKQNLVYRLLAQQEELKNDVARELHDTVIADLMTLKRNLASNVDLDRDELQTALQQLIDRLRDICGEFAPRLQDWGLSIAIEALLERVEQNGPVDCVFNCDDDLPSLPDIVELNVFRIVQECLNNVTKYANASRVTISLGNQDGEVVCTIQDNGVGFDPAKKVRSGSSGLGLSSMKDRVEVIRAFFPATLSIESAPGAGTRVVLNLKPDSAK